MPAILSCVGVSEGLHKLFPVIVEGIYAHFFRLVQNCVMKELKHQRQLQIQIINLMVEGLTKTKGFIHTFLNQYTFTNDDMPLLDDLEGLMLNNNKEFLYDPILPIINQVNLCVGESFSDIYDDINNVIIIWLEETEEDFDYSTRFDSAAYLEYWREGWVNLVAPEENYIFHMGLTN